MFLVNAMLRFYISISIVCIHIETVTSFTSTHKAMDRKITCISPLLFYDE